MDRIYHRYEDWECFKAGFFNRQSGQQKIESSQKIIDFFSDQELTEKYMRLVIEKWPKSSEHNLTNISMNRVAWLGQASVCLYLSIPYLLTMESWRLVPEKYQIIACDIAESIIKEYEKLHK